jgi:hypothetical protein
VPPGARAPIDTERFVNARAEDYYWTLRERFEHGDADEPETVAVARETIELAYLVAVQHLAPRPRAV